MHVEANLACCDVCINYIIGINFSSSQGKSFQFTRKKYSTGQSVAERVVQWRAGSKCAIILQAACTGYFDDSGVLTERVWTNPYQNYDNVGKAILSLFIAVTLNGYSRKLLQI